jgi:hypothetical protein
MRDPGIRGLVHSAMRASRFNEHKLVLQDFLTTPEGERVLAATAAGLGQTLTSTRSSIANLPALDFYLPFTAHRHTWKSTADVYVATTFDPDVPAITAYGTNGQTLTVRQADGTPAVPLIILHPAEPKSTHDLTLADLSSEVIENAAGTPTANSSIAFAPPTASFTILPPDSGSGNYGGGGGTSTGPGTYITHFNIQASDGWFGDQEEMRFQSYAVAGNWHIEQFPNGSWHLIADYICEKGLYTQDGVNRTQGYYGPYLISPTVVKNSFLTCNGYPAVYAIHIYEVDGDIGQNDDYGWRFWAAGGYPSGATYDTVLTYYANTFPPEDANTSAYFRITIQ